MKRILTTIIGILFTISFILAQGNKEVNTMTVNNKIAFGSVYPGPDNTKINERAGDLYFNARTLQFEYLSAPGTKKVMKDSTAIKQMIEQNTTFPADITFTNVTISGKVYIEVPHSKLVFADSTLVITGGDSIQVTNAQDSLYRVLDCEGLTYIKGDTMQVIDSGGYNIIVSLRGFGTNAVDWHIQTARLRGGVTTYGDQVITFTTTGTNNRNGGSAVFYNEYKTGDKIWIALTREGGSGDFTAKSGAFNMQLLYRK